MRTRNRSSIHSLCSLASLVVLTFMLSACANGEFRPNDPFDRELALEDKQKAYTDYVRWSKFDEAAAFVVVEERSAFLRAMPDFKEMRFSDWELAPYELDEELRNTEIKVTYTGYSLRSPIEVEMIEIQKWTRVGNGSDWTVKSSFVKSDPDVAAR
jgi:hypothetical protein